MKYNLEIVKQKLLEYGYYLDENEYINNKTKMKCHDKDGFKYLITMDDYRTGRHPYKFVKANPFTIDNIQLILDKETDGTKILETEYIDSKIKMKFQCSCGSIFYANANSIGEGKRYCNYCAKSKRYDGLVDYTSLVRQECEKRNYTLLTENITRTNQNFQYICNKHKDKGIQQSFPNRFLNAGQGCKYCGIESRGIKHRVNLDDAIKLVEEKGFEYVDSLYLKSSENTSSKLKIKYICKKHRDKGVQISDYQNLKHNTSGCMYCNGFYRTKESLQQEFDDLRCDLEIIEFRRYTDIIVKCRKCNNIWNTTGISILSGHGCPYCYKSNYEKIIEGILCKNGIEYIPQYKFNDCRDINPLPFDFYVPDNILIEVDGQGHFRPVKFRGMSDDKAFKNFFKTKYHDCIKDKYCLDNGIKLIRIPYNIIDDKTIDTEKYLLEQI